MRPRVLSEAEVELLEAVIWYEDHRTGLGLEFYESIMRTCEAIGSDPGRFPIYEAVCISREVRRALVDRFPFAVIFEIRKEEILIVAIAHASRDPGYWQNR